MQFEKEDGDEKDTILTNSISALWTADNLHIFLKSKTYIQPLVCGFPEVIDDELACH